MNEDPEIIALDLVFNALKDLEKREKKRIIKWLKAKFLKGGGKLPGGQESGAEQFAAGEAGSAIKKFQKREIKDYDTALDLFSEARVKTSTDKILLMAAFLQERFDYKEISTYDISFRLKRINQRVSNISNSINNILQGEPPLLDEIKTGEQGKHARKKYRVSEVGLETAAGLL
ncbi:MAG: hypothetical protein KAW12_20740 [Candidatus Aminicenantes bacterium]|nr:hypothetical protein [Candidatus Aminicenantes bacterium]